MNNYALSIDYKNQEEWAVAPMWLEMTFGAIGGGLFIISLICQFALGIVIGFLVLAAGKGIFLLADLGKPTRFLKVFSKPSKSWISKGAWFFLLFCICGFLTAAPLVFMGMDFASLSLIFKVCAYLAGIFAIFLIIYDGFFLAMAKGVGFWNNGALPMLFGFSAMAGGIGSYFIVAAIAGVEMSNLVIAGFLFTLIALAVAVITFVSTSNFGNSGAKHSIETLTKGKFAGSFWFLTVIVGIALPLAAAVVVVAYMPLSAYVLAGVGVLTIIGVISLRYSILKAGVYSPVA